MSGTVICVENVSKLYRLGEVGTGSLAHDVNRWWHKVRGKEDPYAKVGQTNDRTQAAGDSDYAWALQGVSFEVRKGEVLGIIGRNGAGKSTLLKILSRVTTQSSGQIKVKGRIASLLEVGTGFHPELTGRENIFLNGAILGMRKAEIARKFDEIVEFSGCARYIDTPVKRYSSGMYVRLAFAVAAHLEPEILIVDEVLAVGDAEFQKKCLGKMKDVAGHGRTILFVSHNMTAVAELCSRAIYLKNGRMEMNAGTDEVVTTYLAATMPPLEQERSLRDIERREGVGELIRIHHVKLLGDSARIPFGAPLQVEIQAQALVDLEDVFFGVGVNVPGGARLFTSEAYDNKINILKSGQLVSGIVKIPYTGLSPGIFTLSLGVNRPTNLGIDWVPNALTFEVTARANEIFYGNRQYLGLRPESQWEYMIYK